MVSGPLTLAQAYALALAHHQAGRLESAEAIYRQILAVDPDHSDTLHLLGLIEHQRGRFAWALELITRSLALNPHNVSACSNLGEVHKALGQWELARVSLERALSLDPRFVNALNNLGAIHLRSGRHRDALDCFERAVAVEPDNAATHTNLGVALEHLRQRPRALAHYERALALRPDVAEIHFGYACSLSADDRVEEAVAHLRRALELKPDHAQACSALAGALAARLKFSEAGAWAERGLSLDPRNAGCWAGRACSQKELGDVAAAVESYRRAVELAPDDPSVGSDLIYTLHFDPATTPDTLRAECERWNARHVVPLRPRRLPHPHDPDPARRLRVGYLSPDLRDHAVKHFVAPLLAAHDRAGFEVHCYQSGRLADADTARLRTLVDHWHEVDGLADDALDAQLRADGIDILVELSLHTCEHRLLAMARRPAPVQVSWLGHAGTSGVEGIDYRFTDARLDPPGAPEGASWSLEEPVRLPDSWICYEPMPDAPGVGPLPALGPAAGGQVTFGSLNQSGKQHAAVLRLWARLLAAVPGSRLVLYHADPAGQASTRQIFEAAGIDRSRLLLTGRMTKAECLRAYDEWFDLALDPFPYQGMTTTCEALWMGVPVVTLPGALPVSRTGLSLLTAVGLPELVAYDEDHYVRIAVELAGDLPRLAALRAGLRERMRSSPLMDAPRFARHVENAYRAMWRRWCEEKGHFLSPGRGVRN